MTAAVLAAVACFLLLCPQSWKDVAQVVPGCAHTHNYAQYSLYMRVCLAVVEVMLRWSVCVCVCVLVGAGGREPSVAIAAQFSACVCELPG